MQSAALVLLAAIATPAGGPDASGDIAWIHNDWAAAAKDAEANGRNVFVDVWATWCHTCLSMKNFVLKDARLDDERNAYTWLALDSDHEPNAAFFAKNPVTAVPTFMIMSPDGQVHARKIGAASVSEMKAFLAKGHGNTELVAAERLLAQGEYTSARVAFNELLRRTRTKRLRPRLWAGYIEAAYRSDPKACARRGVRALPELPATGGSIETIWMLKGCVDAEPPHAGRVAAGLIRDLLRGWRKQDNLPLTIDDRSSMLGLLIETSETLQDAEAARGFLLERQVLLEKAAQSAPNAIARATFDPHRTDVYLKLRQYERAIRMLKASEAAQPKDFNHPWRQAVVYLADGDTTNGLEAIERAIANGYGGRKIRLYSTKLDLLIAAERWAEAEATVRDGERLLARVHPRQVRASWKQAFYKRVAKVLP